MKTPLFFFLTHLDGICPSTFSPPFVFFFCFFLLFTFPSFFFIFNNKLLFSRFFFRAPILAWQLWSWSWSKLIFANPDFSISSLHLWFIFVSLNLTSCKLISSIFERVSWFLPSPTLASSLLHCRSQKEKESESDRDILSALRVEKNPLN